MKHELIKLPYEYDALEPMMSKETLEYHHGKHHATYIAKLNGLIEGTEYESSSLVEIIKNASGPIFNNAAQVYNHDFFWTGLSPENTTPSLALDSLLVSEFGSIDEFKKTFIEKAVGLFGSGWVWLCIDEKGKLSIVTTSNADNPLKSGLVPLLVCDVWEHAYYIDYRNLRPKYLEEFWDHINWDFVMKTFEKTDNDVFIGIEPCNDIHDPFCQILDDLQNGDRVTS